MTVEHFLGEKYTFGTTMAAVQINRKDRTTFYYFTYYYVDDIVKTTR